jgi:integrase/recombinase XerD
MCSCGDTTVMTADDMVQHHLDWMKESYAARSIAERCRVLKHAHAARTYLPHGLSELHPDWISAYVWRPGLSLWSRHTYWSHLHGLTSWAAAEGWLEYDPCDGVRVPPNGPRRPKPVTAEQLRHALTKLDDPWRTLVVLAAGLGLRVSEAAELDREDVGEQWTRIRRTKGGGERWVATSNTVWTAVKDRPPGRLLRHPRTGQPVTGAWLSCQQRAVFDAIDLGDVHPHRFRHTYACLMLDGGANLLAVRDQMGHKSLATTEVYLLVSGEATRAAVRAVDLALGGGPARV